MRGDKQKATKIVNYLPHCHAQRRFDGRKPRAIASRTLNPLLPPPPASPGGGGGAALCSHPLSPAARAVSFPSLELAAAPPRASAPAAVPRSSALLVPSRTPRGGSARAPALSLPWPTGGLLRLVPCSSTRALVSE